MPKVNGRFQSAVTGIPVVNSACDGRAHPTGVMGSMDLESDPEYHSIQPRQTAIASPAAGCRPSSREASRRATE